MFKNVINKLHPTYRDAILKRIKLALNKTKFDMKELNEVPDLESCYRLLGIAESRLMLLREVENLLIKGTDNRFVFKIRAKEFFNLFKITINQINLIGKLIKYHLLEESKTWTL